VLIGLAKLGRINLLHRVFPVVLVAPAVRHETVEQGLVLGAPEVIYLQRAIDDGWLEVTQISDTESEIAQRLAGRTSLHAGEIESLAIAAERRRVLLADDKEPRSAARALGVTTLGSAGLLFAAFRLGALDITELDEAVTDLARVLWISADVVADIMRRAREMSH
jgi:predicted nucleic acid-binding protein